MSEFKQHIQNFAKGNITFSQIYNYLLGTVRWKMYNNTILRDLLRTDLKYTFIKRKRSASECSQNGQCYSCTCTTPALFFAPKGCEASQEKPGPVLGLEEVGGNMQEIRKTVPCYPPFRAFASLRDSWSDIF